MHKAIHDPGHQHGPEPGAAPGHSHRGHDHSQLLSERARTDERGQRRLVIVFVLVAIYTLAEVIGGWYTGSLALLADASHMLSDVAALGVALGAIWLARRPASRQRTFGFHRAEVLGALINGVALVVVAVFILTEAFGRLREPPEVLGGPMLLIAAGGLLVNATGLLLLHGGDRHSLNLRGVWLHMMADTLGSLGAIVAAVLIWLRGYTLADPVVSIFIGLLVMWSSLALLRETVDVLMEAAPSRLDLSEVTAVLEQVAGVRSVHDVHAWTISSGREALTAHVVVEEGNGSQTMLPALNSVLRERFGLTHVTIQVERAEMPCTPCAFEAKPAD